MRHGFSVSNELGIIACDESSITEYGLTEVGRQQAANVAQKFRPLAEGVPVIISSDYLRARQTADIFAAEFGAQVVADKRLRERNFGDLHGADFVNFKKVWNVTDDMPDATPYNAESTRALVNRVQAVIDAAEETYSGKTIVLVSHGDPLVAINSYYINGGFGPKARYMDNAEIRALKNPNPIITPKVLLD